MRISPIQNYDIYQTNNAKSVSFGEHISGGYFSNDVFESDNKRDKLLLSQDEGLKAANKFKSSTSGYRGSTDDIFTKEFVYSMTNATVRYMKENNQIITSLGGDTRDATKKYAPYIKDIFLKNGIDVFVPKLTGAKKDEISPVATPVLAVFSKNFMLPLTVLLTASHNPWKDGGYNFLTSEGAVADEKITNPLALNLEKITKNGNIEAYNGESGREITYDPYQVYAEHLKYNNIIDFDKIKSQDISIFYDDLKGTGSYYFPRLLSDNGIKIKEILRTKTEGPNPNEENLKSLAKKVVSDKSYLKIGLANDGDSDRFGVVDENGKFISADDVIMLAAYHAIKNKGMKEGTIITNQASSAKIGALVKCFNDKGCDIDLVQTPVGFKYISVVIENLEKSKSAKQMIVAGEESGGLTVRGNIPEKDGFVALLTMLELVASEKKPIGEILAEVNDKIGNGYTSKCINMKFDSDDAKNAAVQDFQKYLNGDETAIAGMPIDDDKTHAHNVEMSNFREGGDGIKVYLKGGASVLVRKSGTEPIMRLYVNGSTPDEFNKLSDVLVKAAEDKGGKIKA